MKNPMQIRELRLEADSDEVLLELDCDDETMGILLSSAEAQDLCNWLRWATVFAGMKEQGELE